MNFYKYISLVLIAGFVLILAHPAAVTAQNSELDEVIRQAHEAGVEPIFLDGLNRRADLSNAHSDQAVMTIVQLSAEMAENQLPYELIFEKALEGLAKGVSSGQIETAVINIRQNTDRAAGLVDPWIQKDQNNLPFDPEAGQSFRDGLIVTISNVMKNDISAEAAGQLLSALSDASFPPDTGPAEIIAAIRILPEITDFTGRSDTAISFVIRAVKGGFNADELHKIPLALRYSFGRDQLPATAMIETVSGQMHGFLPSSRILDKLMRNELPAEPVRVNPVGEFQKGVF